LPLSGKIAPSVLL